MNKLKIYIYTIYILISVLLGMQIFENIFDFLRENNLFSKINLVESCSLGFFNT
jgi:hypothetical protein